ERRHGLDGRRRAGQGGLTHPRRCAARVPMRSPLNGKGPSAPEYRGAHGPSSIRAARRRPIHKSPVVPGTSRGARAFVHPGRTAAPDPQKPRGPGTSRGARAFVHPGRTAAPDPQKARGPRNIEGRTGLRASGTVRPPPVLLGSEGLADLRSLGGGLPALAAL